MKIKVHISEESVVTKRTSGADLYQIFSEAFFSNQFLYNLVSISEICTARLPAAFIAYSVHYNCQKLAI